MSGWHDGHEGELWERRCLKSVLVLYGRCIVFMPRTQLPGGGRFAIVFLSPNVKVTGAARIYRAASVLTAMLGAAGGSRCALLSVESERRLDTRRRP